MNLSHLNPGDTAIVSNIKTIANRLQNIGLIKGTHVTCLHKSPLGDPTAFLIRGAVIALRLEDSSCVEVDYE